MNTYKRFETPSDVEKWVNSVYSKTELLETDVKHTNIQALTEYKGGLYRVMNEYLRKGIEDIQQDYDIQGLQLFLKSRTIKESIMAYRFISIKEWCWLLWKTYCHKETVYPAFLSTTLLKKYYSMDEIKRNRIAVEIKIPKGVNGTYISEVNPYLPEYEFLLPHHIRMKRVGFKSFEVVLN